MRARRSLAETELSAPSWETKIMKRGKGMIKYNGTMDGFTYYHTDGKEYPLGQIDSYCGQCTHDIVVIFDVNDDIMTIAGWFAGAMLYDDPNDQKLMDELNANCEEYVNAYLRGLKGSSKVDLATINSH